MIYTLSEAAWRACTRRVAHRAGEGRSVTTDTGTHAERTLDVAGRKVRVLDGGSGPPLVMLHHSVGSHGWMPFHDQLAARFHVYAPDLPGYGQSERPEWARDPRDIAILVNCLIDRLGLGRVTLLGAGFGGFVAAELATMNPAGLERLILIGAAGLQPREGEILDQMLIDYPEYVQAGFRSDTAYHSALGEDPAAVFKELWDFSREMTARLTWRPYMFNRRLPHLLREVTTPTLVIWGERDVVIPPVCGRQYLEALPNARLEVVPEAGHLVEMEEPTTVVNLIAAFVGG